MATNLVSSAKNFVDASDIPIDLRQLLIGINIESRIDLTETIEVRTDWFLAADIVRFAAGVTLQIGAASHRYIVLYAKKLVLPGGDNRTFITIPKHPIETGTAGSKGSTGSTDHSGEKGADGGMGGDGPEGKPMPTFVMLTDEIEFLIPPTSDRPLDIDVSGSTGGTGGTGGEGGKGGDGRDGQRGASNI